jgi:hypothetical protein
LTKPAPKYIGTHWLILNQAAGSRGVIFKSARDQKCIALERKGLLKYEPQPHPEFPSGPAIDAWRLTKSGWAAVAQNVEFA